MKTFLRHCFLPALLLISVAARSQAPTISYSTPQTYLAGFPITPLTPTGTALTNLAYATPATLLTGLNRPDGVAIDAAGNIYYSSALGNIVYKLPAGSGTPVSYGTGFNAPAGLAVDALGNVYVADYGNGKVKKIPVGGGTPVSIGTVLDVVSVACDASGNVYAIGDNVYKIAPGGSPILLTSPTAGFGSGTGIAVDLAGNVYYARGNIIKYTASNGVLSVIASGTAAYSIAVDAAGNVFFTENTADDVKMLPTDGSAIITLSTHNNGPQGIALDANENVYVADRFGSDIKSISPVGGYFLNKPLPTGMVLSPVTGVISGLPVTISPSTIYTVFAHNASGAGSTSINITVNLPPAPTLSYASPKSYSAGQTIPPLTPTSSSVAPQAYGSPSFTGSGYTVTDGFAMDASGNTYFDNTYAGGTIYKIPAGSTLATAIATGVSAGGLATDATGNLFIASGATIQEIAVGQNTITTFASGFSRVTHVATDVNGNVYFTDYGNNMVEKIPAGGGTPVSLGSGFTNPEGIAVDAAGDVFVTDNSALKKIPANGGSVVTIDAAGKDAGVLAADASGDVFVGETLTALNNAFNQVVPAIVEYPANGGPPVDLYYSVGLGSGIALDAKGDFFCPSNPGTFNQAILELKPTGGYYFNSLPAGLQVSLSTGVISGTPATAKVATNYTGIAYNLAGSATSTTSITIANPYLSGLSLSRGTLSPAFAPATTGYSAFIGAAATSVTVTPTVANSGYTITVNGSVVASGHTSAAIPLTTGPNTITIVVSAAGGNKTTYTLIAGTGSDDAYMSNIKLNNGATALSPTFAFETLNYTASVGNGITSVTVTPKILATGTTICVNGTAVTSGTTSAAIPLNIGANMITVTGRAQDSVTYTTYAIVVTRAASNDAYLSNLVVNTATLSPAFAFRTLNYTSSVPNGTSLVTVKAAVLEADATIQVDGTDVANKADSPPIALAVGSNTISILVTAQDGVTTETYTVTITRASGGMDSYVPKAIGTCISVSNPAVNPPVIGEDIKVHPGVSPNGDGIDDVFIIDNIINYPDNKVMIMDRNGAIIYQAKGYDNLTKAFDGHSNITGKMQLPGNYFYALDYTANGVAKRKTGFIVLKY